MKSIITLLLFLFPLFSFGLSHDTPKELYQHMMEVNENWRTQDPSLYSEITSFQSDRDRIQKHLLLVEKNLRNVCLGHLSEKQKVNRLNTLDILRAYALRKAFPANTHHSVRQPYFIDIYGTHCAVGFLLKETGFGGISQSISEKQNYAYVREIESPELLKWSVDYGFSLTELGWIQPTYMPSQSYTQLGQGSNGKVTKSVGYFNTWYFSGEFDSLNNLPCLQVGMYKDGQLSCLGSGIDGEINDIDYNSTNGLTVTGHFINNGVYYPMASFQNNIWTYHEIPNRPEARGTAFGSVTTYRTYVAIDHPSQPGEQEIWTLSNNGFWSKLANVFGSVNEISGSGTYVGVFDSSEVWVNGNLTVLQSKNVLIRTYMEEWEPVSGIVPDTVFTFTEKQNVLYVGGTASTDANSSGVLVSSILNNFAQPIMIVADLAPSSNYNVYNLDVVYSEIYASGDFQFANGIIGNFGRNIARLHPSSGTVSSFGYVDSTVYTFNKVNTTFFIAGDFSSNFSSSGPQSINRLAKLDGFLDLEDNAHLSVQDIRLHPNPSKGELNISGIDKNQIQTIEIIDTQGKIWKTTSESEMDLNDIPSGTYFIRLTNKAGIVSQEEWIKL